MFSVSEIKNLDSEGRINTEGNSTEEILFHTNHADGLCYVLEISCTNEGEGPDPDEVSFSRMLWAETNYLEETQFEILSFTNPEGDDIELSAEEENQLFEFIQTL